ncbi:MAE_28990/MAE_18760 family HEPN-like nuclease [Acinetobacter wuhouensis]|uniref:MAE-28990/MAE-18760-like HEPN domain-containing protein n=1 Tax=Acinetobacter wuhouensis TaxID=1879050 RepID=A0A3G2T3G2_9GAMM|nr:hypothetical protein [Acinetobacter wuhouensis]AYO54621.1 hypothetical protein CDG68_13620 [Acinetobacter wuhouensis]
MKNIIDDFLLIYQTFHNELQKVISFIDEQKKPDSKYSQYRELIYTSIISRTYSLWEDYIKTLAYKSYVLGKDKISDDEILSAIPVHEFPSYALKDSISFDSTNQKLILSLSKDICTFTGKNIDLTILARLFKRFKINIDLSNFNNPSTAVSFSLDTVVTDKTINFQENLDNENKAKNIVKAFIFLRNSLSHSNDIVTFLNLDSLSMIVNYFVDLSNYICEEVIKKTITFLKTDYLKRIGTISRHLTNLKVIVIDITTITPFDKSYYLYMFNNEDACVSILKINAIQVNKQEIEKIEMQTDIGINYQPLLKNSETPGQHKDIYLAA